MREEVIAIVNKYIHAIRHSDCSDLPLHPDMVGEFPTNTYRGDEAFRKGIEQFAAILKEIEIVQIIVDGEHCAVIANIETIFGRIPFAEHIHVVNGEIVWIRGYCDPRPMLNGPTSA